MEKEKIIKELRTQGYSVCHVDSFQDLLSDFNQIKNFMYDLIGKQQVALGAELLREGRPILNRTKFFEFQNLQLLGEGISLDNSPILQFYLREIFLDIAESYLETSEVRIRNCLAFYHPQNPFPPTNSQNWHRDTEDTKILKAFVYYNDVLEQNGSLWYVKNSKHGTKNDNIWPNVGKAKHGYLDAKSVMKIPIEDIVKLEGTSGTIVFFDSNGFHKGGNVKMGYRIATHCCYLRHDAPHILNGILPKFEYNKNINFVDKLSTKYKNLSERQKRFLQ